MINIGGFLTNCLDFVHRELLFLYTYNASVLISTLLHIITPVFLLNDRSVFKYLGQIGLFNFFKETFWSGDRIVIKWSATQGSYENEQMWVHFFIAPRKNLNSGIWTLISVFFLSVFTNFNEWLSWFCLEFSTTLNPRNMFPSYLCVFNCNERA